MKKNEKIPYGDRLDLQQADKLPFFATHAGMTVSALLMLVIVIVILALQLGSGGSISYNMDHTQLAVVCMDRAPIFIPFDTISNVELVESFQLDKTIEATNWDSGWCGTCENEKYGSFTLYAYSSPGSYIVVEYQNEVLIFNVKNQKATEEAYEKLLKRMYV